MDLTGQLFPDEVDVVLTTGQTLQGDLNSSGIGGSHGHDFHQIVDVQGEVSGVDANIPDSLPLLGFRQELEGANFPWPLDVDLGGRTF